MEIKQFIEEVSNNEERIFNIYMDEIAEEIGCGHASAMVGTGFSLNATKIDPQANSIPSWSELGLLFIKELNLQINPSEINFQNPIHLASLYEALFGSKKLDEFLKNQIRDTAYIPSEVHKLFISLNWNDIFTTNYDTLLESANDINKPQNYFVILNEKELLNGSNHRIIKLHGSFPSEKPFIITEEHYRTYPSEHAAFVNTVQQSLIENTLILFGFSGTDPNFIKWTGWIRDNLGVQYANKIYLLSIEHISEDEKKLFALNNINILDMKVYLEKYKNKSISDLFIKMFKYWNSVPSASRFVQQQEINNLSSSIQKQVTDIESNLPNNDHSRKEIFIDNQIEPAFLLQTNDSINLNYPLRKPDIEKEDKPLLDKVKDLSKQVSLLQTQLSSTEKRLLSSKILINNWIDSLWKELFDIDKEIEKKGLDKVVNLFINKWEKERKSFPNLQVLKKSYCDSIYWKTRYIILSFNFLKQLSNTEQSIHFLYELNWRCEICLLPLYDHLIKAYYKAINFNQEKSSISIASFSRKTKQKAYKLLLSLLRSAREDGDKKIYKSLKTIIENNKKDFNDELINEYTYELCLDAFANLEYENIIKSITDWNIATSSYKWNIKKAGLLAEIGKEKEASDILINQLNKLKKLEETDPEKLEYLSLEGSINGLLLWIKSSVNYLPINDSIKIEKEELRNRNKELRLYDCNISEIFNSFADSIRIKNTEKLEKKSVNTNNVQREIILGGEQAPIESFAYLRLYEITGFPYCIRNSYYNRGALSIAINNIIERQPLWAMHSIIRSYSSDIVEQVIDRKALCNFTANEIREIITKILNCFDEFRADLKNGNYFNLTLFCNRMVQTFSELLARLCLRIDYTIKVRLRDFLIELNNEDLYQYLPSFEKFIRGFIESLSDIEKIQFIPYFVNLKFPTLNPVKEMQLLNPWLLLNPPAKKLKEFPNIDITKESIEQLVEDENNSTSQKQKEWYMDILLMLYHWKALDKETENTLGHLIWNNEKDEKGFPKTKNFYQSIYLDLPHPRSINPKKIYTEYLKQIKIPAISDELALVFPQHDHWSKNITLVKDKTVFTNEILENIILQILEVWNKDSKLLDSRNSGDFEDIPSVIKHNFYLSAEIIEKFILSEKSKIINSSSILLKYKDKLIELLNEYYDNNITCLSALALSTILKPNTKINVLQKIEFGLSSLEREIVVDSLNAIHDIFENCLHIFTKKDKTELCNTVADAIFWKSQGNLEDCIHLYTFLINTVDDTIYKNSLHKVLNTLHSYRTSESNDFDKDTIIRKKCVGLAYAIYSYQKKNKLPIFSEVLEWKEIALDEEEFVDIRNQWLDNSEQKEET